MFLNCLKVVKKTIQKLVKVPKAWTMMFEISVERSSRNMSSILKEMRSGEIRHFRLIISYKEPVSNT